MLGGGLGLGLGVNLGVNAHNNTNLHAQGGLHAQGQGHLGGCFPAERNQECADIEAYVRSVDPSVSGAALVKV